jgi:hypothetical protein
MVLKAGQRLRCFLTSVFELLLLCGIGQRGKGQRDIAAEELNRGWQRSQRHIHRRHRDSIELLRGLTNQRARLAQPRHHAGKLFRKRRIAALQDRIDTARGQTRVRIRSSPVVRQLVQREPSRDKGVPQQL